jgi:hypothetical protein
MLEGFCFAAFFFALLYTYCDHVKRKAKKKRSEKRQGKSSEAEFFKHIKIKYHTHLKMAV